MLSEGLTLGEAVVKVLLLSRIISDPLTLNDVVGKVASYVTSRADALTLADNLTKVISFFRSLSDPLLLGEFVQPQLVIRKSLSDAISLGEALLKQMVLLIERADPISLGEVIDTVLTMVVPPIPGGTGGYYVMFEHALPEPAPKEPWPSPEERAAICAIVNFVTRESNMANLFAPPPGFVLPDELEDYYPVNLVTAYRPGGDWSMGVDPEIEGQDLDAHGNPILGRSTMEDYLEGNAEYVTVAMDKASSWQGQYLESPNYPGVPLKVMDNGGFGNNKTGNGWVDIAFRDPEMARNFTAQDVPFRPISEERAKEMVSSRAKPPEGFVLPEEYAAQQALGQGDQDEDRIPLEGEKALEPPPGFVLPEEYEAAQKAEAAPDEKGQVWWKDTINSVLRGGSSEGLLMGMEGLYGFVEARTKGTVVEGLFKPAGEQRKAMTEMRESVRQGLPVDKDFEQAFVGQALQGVGQLLNVPLYVVPGVGEAMTAGQLYQEGYEDYAQTQKKNGLPVDPAAADRAAWKYMAGGAPMEILGDRLIFGKFFKAAKKGGLKAGDVVKAAGQIAASEGTTETGQQFWLNAVAKHFEGYEPDRPLTENLLTSFLVGSTVGLVGGAGSHTLGAKTAPAPPAAPEAAPAPAPAPAVPGVTTSPTAPPETTPEFGPAIGGIRGGLETNLSPEEKAQAAPLASAAAAYVQNYDETLAPAEAHAQAVKEVPDQFKPAFRMLPANAMEAEPAQFGEWLARAYEGGRAPAPAVEGKSVAQMIKEARVQVETKESTQAMEGLAAEPAGTVAPSTTADVEALVSKYQGMVDEGAIAQRKPIGQQATVYQKGRDEIARQLAQSKQMEMFPEEFPESKKQTISEQMFAIEDMVGEQFDKLGIRRRISNRVGSAGISYDPYGNLELLLNPQQLYDDEIDARKAGVPADLMSRLTNGEELIHAADIYGKAQEWRKNPYGQNFFQFMAKDAGKMSEGMQDTFAKAPEKERKALYQSLVDSFDLYRRPFENPLMSVTNGEQLLNNMLTLAQSPEREQFTPSVSFVNEFIRQAKQLERQGTITENSFAKLYQAVQDWVKAALARIKKTLPGASEGKYGEEVKRRLQQIDDVLAGKEVAGPIPVELYQASPEELEMVAARKEAPTAYHSDIVRAHNAKGSTGSTINSVHGNLAGGTTANYSVSVFPELSTPIPGRKVTAEQIRDFAEKARKAGIDTNHPNISIGTWYDPEAKATTLDVVMTTSNRQAAIDLAKQYNQKAIFDLQALVEVPTGGTGEAVTGLPPIKERIEMIKNPTIRALDELERLAKDNEAFKDWYDKLRVFLDDLLGEAPRVYSAGLRIPRGHERKH